jgi:hypothetical protein
MAGELMPGGDSQMGRIRKNVNAMVASRYHCVSFAAPCLDLEAEMAVSLDGQNLIKVCHDLFMLFIY